MKKLFVLLSLFLCSCYNPSIQIPKYQPKLSQCSPCGSEHHRATTQISQNLFGSDLATYYISDAITMLSDYFIREKGPCPCGFKY